MANEPKKRVPAFATIGRTGLRQFGGYVREEWHAKLTDWQAIRIYSEMRDNSPVIGGYRQAIDSLCKRTRFAWLPADDSLEALQNKLFLEQCIDDMEDSWPNILSEALTMLDFGWCLMENLYKYRGGDVRDPTKHSKYDDGMIGWRNWSIRSQEAHLRWDFDENTQDLLGEVQIPPPDYKERHIPVEKLLHFRTRTHKANPQGRSIYRNAYQPYYYVKRIQEIEGIGVERDLAGLPVLQVPPAIMLPGAAPELQTLYGELQTMVSEIRRDEREGIIIPCETDPETEKSSGYKLTLLTGGGRRQIDTDAIIRRYEGRIAMTCLADFMMLGHDKIGAYALSVDKTDLFGTTLEAYLWDIASVINKQAVPQLFSLNGRTLDKLPHLEPGRVTTPPLNELGEFLFRAIGSGAISTGPVTEQAVRMMVGLPEEKDAAMMEAAQKVPPQMQPREVLGETSLSTPKTPGDIEIKRRVAKYVQDVFNPPRRKPFASADVSRTPTVSAAQEE